MLLAGSLRARFALRYTEITRRISIIRIDLGWRGYNRGQIINNRSPRNRSRTAIGRAATEIGIPHFRNPRDRGDYSFFLLFPREARERGTFSAPVQQESPLHLTARERSIHRDDTWEVHACQVSGHATTRSRRRSGVSSRALFGAGLSRVFRMYSSFRNRPSSLLARHLVLPDTFPTVESN